MAASEGGEATCWGSSLMRYWANFWSWSLCSLDRDSETGARRHTAEAYTKTGWMSRAPEQPAGALRGPAHVVDPEEAEGHHVGAPLGPGAAGAAAGRDAAAVEHDGHVVGSFGLAGLVGHHSGAEVET